MKDQISNTVLMVRPTAFRRNEQTAVNNYYQKKLCSVPNDLILERVLLEFDQFVDKLRALGIRVLLFQDDHKADTPDSVFPNNWISFHQNGNVILYPMFAANRRLERRMEIIELVEKHNFQVGQIIDYTSAEEEDVFLEGTGSLVLDRVHRKAYCARSPRANENLLIEFCEDMEYDPIIFTAYQQLETRRLPIYHTNVMMGIGNTFAVICIDAIDNARERKQVIHHLSTVGKEIITINENQLQFFAGNVLQLKGDNDQDYLVMSSCAYRSLHVKQISRIEQHCTIVHTDLTTIETLGGGSARCMMAEVFLPKKSMQ